MEKDEKNEKIIYIILYIIYNIMQNYSSNSNYLSLYNNYGNSTSFLFINVNPNEFLIYESILNIKKINDWKLTGNIKDLILIVDENLNIIESKLNNNLINDNTIWGNKLLNSWLDNTKIINLNIWKLLYNLPNVITYSNNILENIEGKIITNLFDDNTIDAKILLNWSINNNKIISMNVNKMFFNNPYSIIYSDDLLILNEGKIIDQLFNLNSINSNKL